MNGVERIQTAQRRGGDEAIAPPVRGVALDVNLHHLELFYHVARHGGLSKAARKMPYGIQPSTISRQLCLLERQIALSLYERRPFKVTPAGEEIFACIKPLFEDLPGLIRRLHKGQLEVVRLGAPPVVLRDYLPAVLRPMQQTFPALRLTVNEGLPWQIEVWLKEKVIDLAITLLDGDAPSGYQCEALIRLPLILLVPGQSSLRSATGLWKQSRIEEILISPPLDDLISRLFRQGLQRHGKQWPIGMEANSTGLVETYVGEGFGIGVAVALPGQKARAGLRALPLPDFPKVSVGMIWPRNPTAATQALVNEFRREAERALKTRAS